jgi:3-oxoadipate enol-lactonase
MTVTTVRGARLHHQTKGTGPSVIWGHGLTKSRRLEDQSPLVDWSRVPASVTRYDARGHGETDSTPDLDDYSWESLGRDQLVLADALAIDRYVAGGASMGCGTALHAAVLAPEQIVGLVLVIPPTAWETRAAQTKQWEAAAHVASTKGVEPMIIARRAIAPPDPFIGDEEHAANRESAMRSWDTDRLAQVFRGATKADLPTRDAIRAIAAPAMILAWTGDPAHPQTTAEELHDLLPTSTLHLASTRVELDQWTEHIARFVTEGV